MKFVFTILKDIKVADYFTFLNMVFGFLAIYFLFSNEINTSISLLYLAAIMDGVDGIIAQNTEKSLLGKNLDSLSDIVSFGVYPAILISRINSMFIFASSLYLLTGVLRLARFNVLEREDFVGCPITVSALILASEVLLKFDAILILITILLLSFLMISDINYPKVRKKGILTLAGLVILITMLFHSVAYLIILGMILYILYPGFKKLSAVLQFKHE